MNKSILKKLTPYLYQYRYKFLFLIFLAIIGNILTLIGPYLVGKAVNVIHIDMSKENFIYLAGISVALLFTYISGAFLSLIQNIKMNKISQEIVNVMRKNAFNKIHKFPLKVFNSMAQGNILTILINDIDNISSSLSQIGTRIVVNILTISTALGIMIYISPSLTLIQLALVSVTGLFLKGITKKSKEKRRVQQRYLGKLNSYVDEILTGQAEVKSFSYEERAIEKFKKLNDDYRETAIKTLFFSGFNFPTLNFINNIGYSLIIFTGAIFMLKGKINLGELSSFIIYSKLFNRPIASISEAYNIIQTVIVSSERFFSFMELEEDSVGGEKELIPEKIKGEIEFRDVNFSYDDEVSVLKNLSFKAGAGKVVAIVGPTGGGKTTIVNLLMKFYDISSGEILLDGINIDEYKKSDIRKLFGMVLQDTWLFNGTIKENLMYGKLDASDEEVKNACEMAYVDHFVNTLEDGYDTVLDEETSNISQGQKQLLTIARAFLKDPKILILDEATSSVDTRTEVLIQKGMEKLMEGRTSFVIAHRLSTIRDANTIIVMKDGDIVEIGNHDELLEKGGFYASLYQSQFEGSEI